MTIDRKKLYEATKRVHDLCDMVQQGEDEKGKQGDSLAVLRATELNQYLAVFRASRDYLSTMGPDTISQEELEEINNEIGEARSRFSGLLKNPQSAGKTGEIAVKEAEKEKAKGAQSE